MEFNGLFIRLRKIEPADITLVANWLSSEEFKNNLYEIYSKDGRDSYENIVINFMQENANDLCPNKYFIIESKSREIPIGLSLIKNIDWKNRTAEHNYIIGEESNRNSIYGGDTSISVCYYLFNTLNLNKVIGYTYDFNIKAQRINNFASKKEGILKKHHKHEGSFINVIINGVTKRNFNVFIAQNKKGLLHKYFSRGIFK
ncbi:MAG: RimJ/RimL family protein N-acetyltransferase [Alteromonadaceae bacterium]|jgi:RimJ/RimL family protein N-acetyltransferase